MPVLPALPNKPSLAKPSGEAPSQLHNFDLALIASLYRVLIDLHLRVNLLTPRTSISDPPEYVGQFAMVAGAMYVSVDTTDPSDWAEVAFV